MRLLGMYVGRVPEKLMDGCFGKKMEHLQVSLRAYWDNPHEQPQGYKVARSFCILCRSTPSGPL